jgi:hypothetical protein
VIFGTNIHSRFGNVDPDFPIPAGYILKSGGALDSIIQELWTLRVHMRVGRVRTLLWMAERDPVDTPWLHVPLLPEEIGTIRQYLQNSPVPVTAALGLLWEARWLHDENGIDIPADHPFETVGELFDAICKSVWPILFNADGRPALPSHIRLDIFSEFDLADTQEPLMAHLYGWARDACKLAKIQSTVSCIIPPDCSPMRVLSAYDWLVSLGCGLPDVMTVNINGVPDAAIIEHFPAMVAELRDAYGIPVCIGEDDQERGSDAMAAICSSGVTEHLSW